MLFVAGESFLSAALEAEPSLLEYAADKQVVLATPTTLIALLRTVAYAWTQQTLADKAREIHTLGRDLHDGVLQTLAALRVRCATLRDDLIDHGSNALKTEVQAIEQVIVAEQSQLRKFLVDSRDQAEAVGREPGAELERDEQRRREDRDERRAALTTRVVGGRHGGSVPQSAVTMSA